MFTQSLDYPRSGTDTLRTILIGSLLTLLGVLVVPLVLVGGYTVAVVRSVLAEEAEPPAFADWRALLVDGLKASVIAVVYFALPALVLAATGLVVLLVFDGTPGGTFLSGAVALVGVGVAGALFLACWYVGAAGFVEFARTDRLGAAFALRELRPVLTSGTYATSFGLAVVVLVASSVLGGVLELLPTVLAAVGNAVVAFYAAVSMSYLHARGVAGATAVEPATEAPAVQPAD